ncbi:MAG: hypothetical protein NTV05_00200 [Acidobacteria bacterium]|nr:hypothetical protein [Acidobacteriota bacterium]
MQTRIRQTCLFAVLALGLVVELAGTTLAQSNDPRLGTWKLNLAKSTYAAGTAPKSVTFTTVAAGAGVKVTVDTVAADGTVEHWAYTANYDGKDFPIVGNNSQADTGARTRVDANTVRTVYKKAGKVAVTQTSVVSSDGKTISITSTGTDAKGQTVKSVAVYDKQ